MQDYLLQDPNICTCVPYLRTSQTIPAEGQDIISGSQGCWNIHLILESPRVAGRQIFRNVHFSPFWPRWSCPNRGRFQLHWYPTPLEILWLGDPWLPIKPRSFLIYPTLSDCLVYKWMDFEWYFNVLASNFVLYLRTWDALSGNIHQWLSSTQCYKRDTVCMRNRPCDKCQTPNTPLQLGLLSQYRQFTGL